MNFMNELLVNCFLAGVILLLLYRYFLHNCYWENKRIPFEKQNSIFSWFETGAKATQELQIERYRKFGRVYGYYENNCPALAISEPELLKNILVKDFKFFSVRRNEDNSVDSFSARMINNLRFDDWKRVRMIITPTFTTAKIKKVMSIFIDCSQTLIKNFETARQQQNIVEVKRLFHAFTMDVIANSLFSTKIDSLNNPNNPFVNRVNALLSHCHALKHALFLLTSRFLGCNWSYKLFFISANFKFLENAAFQIIQLRKKTGKVGNDLLQLLMDASVTLGNDIKFEDTVKDNTESYKNEFINSNRKISKSLSDDELTAQCVILLMAGFHTISSALSCTTYLLALHEDVQEKLYQEIMSVLEQSDGIITYEDVQKMKYLDNVLSESLRLYPPQPELFRVAVKDYNLGYSGIIIPKGMKIRIPAYALHRDPELYHQPNQFDPDRFNADNRSNIIPYSYLPFGAGPRNCVAMAFALLEVKVCLVHLVSFFHIHRCPQTKVPMEFYNGKPLVPQRVLAPKDISVKIELRKDNIFVK